MERGLCVVIPAWPLLWIPGPAGCGAARRSSPPCSGGHSGPRAGPVFPQPLQLAGKIAGQGGKAARDGDVDGEELVMSALDLGSYISKIPVGPVTRRARRSYEQWQEGEGTPLSVIMPRAN